MTDPHTWSFGDVSLDRSVRVGGGLHTGDVFAGRYRIDEELGAGAMSWVHRCWDLTADRPVAIKILRPSLAPNHKGRFLREGRLTAALNHPGILRIHGGGVTDDHRMFLVLELLEGAVDLETAWQRQPDQGLDLLLQTTRAMAHAHQSGVVHRDLKPDNVLVDRSGLARVCDFGLAWTAESEKLTKTGSLLGTPRYMAPEAFAGERLLPSADVWALGVMLYQCLTGETPFPHELNLTAYGLHIQSARPIRPRAHDPGISRALEAVCLQALETDPQRRFPDAGAMAEALEQAIEGRAPRGRAVWLLLACVLCFALGLWLVPASPPPATTPPPPTPTAPDTRVEAASSPQVPGSLPLLVLVELAHRPVPFDPELLEDFDAALLAADDDSQRDTLALERLRYLLRRGRWERVLLEAPELEQRSATRTEAALIHVVALYELLRQREAIRVASKMWDRSGTVASLTLGAWSYILVRQPAPALKLLERAHALEPERVDTLIAMGWAHGQQRDIQRSQEFLERARRISPDHPTVYHGLITCDVNLGDKERAIEHGETLVRLIEPEPVISVLLMVATLLNRMGEYRKGAVYGERILAREPTHATGAVLVAISWLNTGRRDQAAELLRKTRRRDQAEFERAVENRTDPAMGNRLLELSR